MVPQFNGKEPDPELTALDILLEGKSYEYKGRVLEYVRKLKIDANDPAFLLTVGIGNLDVALIDLPKAIEASVKKLNAEIVNLTDDLRSMFQSAILQLKIQIQANNEAESRLKRQFDTASDMIIKAIAESKKHRNENLKIIKIINQQHLKLVDERNIQNQEILTQLQQLRQDLEAERQLRMNKPWRNAINLPSWMFLGVGLGMLGMGILIGININNQSAKIDEMKVEIQNLNPNTLHLGVDPPSKKVKKSQH
jgi:hypothetical protein